MAEWLREMSVGEWYQADQGPFEIVGVDAKAEIILIQHFDGTLEEVDFDAWTELSARPIPPPEDYSGSMDFEREDYGLETREYAGGNSRWSNPSDLLDAGNF